jgi:hypothetical protein
MRREYEIFDGNGDSLGRLTLSQNQMKTLATGGVIAVRYHTPQRLRDALGDRHGLFELKLDAGGHITATDPGEVKRYIELLDAIEQAHA